VSVAVKICGVCSAADAAMAAAAGADYLGVILAPGYGRTRELAAAADIFAGAAVRRVGVFVDPQLDDVLRAVDRLELDVVQLHGRETPAFSRLLGSLGVEIWKRIPVRVPADIGSAADYAGIVHGIVLEGETARGTGGVGAAFDWGAVAAARERVPHGLGVVLAGGLDPDNVGGAVALLRPDVVDVSSGVEVTFGRKSAERVHAFISAARGAAPAGGASR
jgi:phosphoribosylanthranilate isomerase